MATYRHIRFFHEQEAIAWRAKRDLAHSEYEAAAAAVEKAVAQSLASTPRGVYIWGPVGVGKRHIYLRLFPFNNSEHAIILFRSFSPILPKLL